MMSVYSDQMRLVVRLESSLESVQLALKDMRAGNSYFDLYNSDHRAAIIDDMEVAFQSLSSVAEVLFPDLLKRDATAESGGAR